MDDVSEALAHALHDSYLRRRQADGETLGSTPSLRVWDELPEEFRESTRRNAHDIVVLVCGLGYELRLERKTVGTVELGEHEIERLAERMHERWVEERETNGWRFGTRRNDAEKLHPDLVPWDELSHETQEINRHFLQELPSLLEDVGLALARRE